MAPPSAQAAETLVTPLAVSDLLDRWPAAAERPFPVLLDSGGDARWSLLATDPCAVLIARDRDLSLWRGGQELASQGDPFEALRDLLAERPLPAVPGLPFPGGAIGAFGYDLGRHLERLPRQAKDDLGFPDLVAGIYDRFEIQDRLRGQAWSVSLPGSAGPRAIRDADYRRTFGAATSAAPAGPNFTRERYLAALRRVKEYIAAGDVYQVNLSQRFHARSGRTPLEVYRALRAASPAPFGAFLQFGGRSVLSASPEQFLELRGRRALTRPIKGTRRRGGDPESDARLRAELLASSKDDAELAMIVDLERNDLGRVCDFGSVRVLEPKTLETHPTVFHLSAAIEGRLREGLGPVDLLRAAFPGGSITGAPKIRAMQIIDELEPTRRAFYTGAIGCIGFDGSMNLSIAIRTLLQDGADYTFQAGGGVVADSDPAAEYEETLTKALALARALGLEGAAS